MYIFSSFRDKNTRSCLTRILRSYLLRLKVYRSAQWTFGWILVETLTVEIISKLKTKINTVVAHCLYLVHSIWMYLVFIIVHFCFCVLVLNMESMLVCIQSISLSYNNNYNGERASWISGNKYSRIVGSFKSVEFCRRNKLILLIMFMKN